MRALWILRHAKAGPHVPDDHARPIIGRGQHQCAALAALLTATYDKSELPPLALSSTALRARQTAEQVLSATGAPTAIELEDALYETDADGIIDRVRLVDDDLESVMVVGHNPALSDLALLVLQEEDGKGHRKLRSGLPTCALAVVSFDVGRWSSVSAAGGRLERLFVPKVH